MIFQPGHSLAMRLEASRLVTDNLFALVRPHALYDRPIAERHRLIFYVGHLEAFDANLFRATLGDVRTPSPGLDRLFAFGIDPIDGNLPSDRPADWPAAREVDTYVRETRGAIDTALAGATTSEQFCTLLNVAIEHRLMHAETLAYLLHNLPLASKVEVVADPARPHPPPTFERIDIPEGKATLGLSAGFGWDNEFAEHSVDVPAFAIDRNKVTNAAFLEFVEAGGYSAPDLWSQADWAWRSENDIRHPAFWQVRGDRWVWRGMFADLPLPPAWPVFVSHAEAAAYARWRGAALPSEPQFHRAAYGSPDGAERAHPWGDSAPSPDRGNFNFVRWDPTAVDDHAAGASAFGVNGLVGNGWEWTSSIFSPFENFKPFSFYPGYSADFFDGKHFVLKGGSMRTASVFLRCSFRNWFQPHYPYVYAGFRCVYS